MGYAAITGGAGDLTARHVIHAASMGLGGIHTTAKSLRTSTAHSLRLASLNETCRRLHFRRLVPACQAFRLDECATIMLGETIRHLKDGSSLVTIYFVLFDVTGCEVFREPGNS